MKVFTLKCDCGCNDPLIATDQDGRELIQIFRTRVAAELAASDMFTAVEGKRHAIVIEMNISE